ncbi:hypothetical protein [Streptomyces milbemycinicus]|uniref:hypothetical protein n=1 Tax=Streptomyces milbemycinicus TaxID=476552 RepID=UPI00340E56B9
MANADPDTVGVIDAATHTIVEHTRTPSSSTSASETARPASRSPRMGHAPT